MRHIFIRILYDFYTFWRVKIFDETGERLVT